MRNPLSILEMCENIRCGDSYQVIDFFGTPGSGKTYLSDMAFKRIKHKEVSRLSIDIGKMRFAKRAFIKIPLSFYLIVMNYGVVFSVIKLIREFHSKIDYIFIKLLFNFLYVLGVVQFCKRRGRIAIMDQGLSQSIWSCVFHGNRKNFNHISAAFYFIQIFSRIGLSDILVVHVVAGPDKVESRLKTRKIQGTTPLNFGGRKIISAGIEATERARFFLNYVSAESRVMSIRTCENN